MYLEASSSAEIGQERRSARKRNAILTAARTVFLRNGYLGTSVDEIAALAAVSKQTVYKHFADKERLFTEIVTTTVNEASDQVYNEVFSLQDSGDIEADVLVARIVREARFAIARARGGWHGISRNPPRRPRG